jgi:hypothetical protein
VSSQIVLGINLAIDVILKVLIVNIIILWLLKNKQYVNKNIRKREDKSAKHS